MKNKTNILILVFSMLFLASCERETKHPLPMGIPDKEIIFVPEEYPSSTNADIKTLGFIDADGSGREEYSFLFAGGAKSMFGMTFYTRYADTPHWSPSGDELAFSIRNTAPNIRLIDSEGYMYGSNCDSIGSPVSFDQNNHLIKILDRNDHLFDEYQYLINESRVALVHFDIKNCAVTAISSLSVPNNTSLVLNISDEASNGQFVVSYYEAGVETPSFFVFKKSEKDYQIYSGLSPELNDDGNLLAYYSVEGTLIVIDLDTGETNDLVQVSSNLFSLAHDMSNPSWSPDSKWLVYSTVEGDIYKINIATKEKVYLTHGWYPDWR